MNNRNGTTMGADGTTTNGDSKLDEIKDSVKGFVDSGTEKVDAIKTRVMDVKDKAMTNGKQYLGQAADFIKANPLKAVGIAFGAGYFGMRLFRR